MDTTKRMPGQPNETAGSHITDPFAVLSDISTSSILPANVAPGQHQHTMDSPQSQLEGDINKFLGCFELSQLVLIDQMLP